MRRFDEWARSVGTDPDPRFTLANERTFLTWMTTCLGMLGIGLAVDTIIPEQSAVIDALAMCWIALAAVLAVRAYARWFKLERAMRLSRGLPLSSSIPIVAGAVAVLGVASGTAIVLAS